MAAITLAARIQVGFAQLISNPTLIDLSNQRDADLVENSVLTARVSEMAAAKVEGKLGDTGSYDDNDPLIGDLTALDLGIRIGLMMYSQMYTLTLTEAGIAFFQSVLVELEDLAAQRRQEATLPVIANLDNDALNARRSHSTWGSTSDPANPPEL